jgi:hypothetical protein
MRTIFISYRRADSEGHTGRLFEDLTDHFGRNAVFMDVVAVEKGRDFRRIIEEHIGSCGVLLVIIGKNWLAPYQAEPRAEGSTDFARIEIATALRRDIPVIPVLVQGARMPREDELPNDLKELVFRNGAELTHARWESDVNLLIDALKPFVDVGLPPATAAQEKPAATAIPLLSAVPHTQPTANAAEGAVTTAGKATWLYALVGVIGAAVITAMGYPVLQKYSMSEAARVANEKNAAELVIAKADAEKAMAEKVAAEKALADKTSAEKLAADKALADRDVKAKADADQRAREKAKADRLAREKFEATRIAREKAEADRIAQEKAVTDRIVAEKAEADRIAQLKAEADRIAQEKAEADRIARLRAEADRLAREKAEADRIARLKAEADRLTREKVEADRIAREKAEAERKRLVSLGACLQGYVWREARSNDKVCVPPASRSQAASDNQLALARREPKGGPYGPATCKQGFVWREAFSGDVVCVTPEIRSRTVDENVRASTRVMR